MKLKGLSVCCFHGPSQRTLVLDSLRSRPDKIPSSFSMNKAFSTDIRLLQMREVANFEFLMKDENATNRIILLYFSRKYLRR